jgi:hypothetical protein
MPVMELAVCIAPEAPPSNETPWKDELVPLLGEDVDEAPGSVLFIEVCFDDDARPSPPSVLAAGRWSLAVEESFSCLVGHPDTEIPADSW